MQIVRNNAVEGEGGPNPPRRPTTAGRMARVVPVSSEVEKHRDEPASAAILQAEIASAREDLVTSLAELKDQVSPAALVRRGKARVTGFFVDEYGGVRPERVAIAAGTLVVLIVLRRRRRASRARRVCVCR